jgi:probable phosphoglycerate mutase
LYWKRSNAVLILLRHGQTAANAKALLQGRMNLPLDPEGELQAKRSGEFLREKYPDALVVCSPLTRAHQTACAISDNVTIDERFIELDYGDWDGVALTDVDQTLWAQWRNDPSFRPPGGETLVELDARVRPAFDEISERARTGDVIVVSHVSPIKSGVTWALGTGPETTWRMQLDRASICRIAIGPRGPGLVGFNETSHL